MSLNSFNGEVIFTGNKVDKNMVLIPSTILSNAEKLNISITDHAIIESFEVKVGYNSYLDFFAQE